MKNQSKNLRLITYKDVAHHCDVCDDKAQKIIARMRKQYSRKEITMLHLFDYLGISDLEVIYELVIAPDHDDGMAA